MENRTGETYSCFKSSRMALGLQAEVPAGSAQGDSHSVWDAPLVAATQDGTVAARRGKFEDSTWTTGGGVGDRFLLLVSAWGRDLVLSPHEPV